MHANYILACTDPDLCQILSYFNDKDIYGILRLFPNVETYARYCEGAGGPKKRPKASQRGRRPPNSPLQELERGAPGRPDILVIKVMIYKYLAYIANFGMKPFHTNL